MQDFKCPPGFQEQGLFLDQSFIDGLDNSQELVLIRIPWHFDIEKLNGQEICLSGSQEFESTGNKTVVVQSSKPSKELQSICTLKKDGSGESCVPVGVNFKRQIDIFESYTFHEPVIPDCVEKRVPFPTGLKERLIPYGSDEPVVCSKRKSSKRKRNNGTNYGDFSGSCEEEGYRVTKKKRLEGNTAIKNTIMSPLSWNEKAGRKSSIKLEHPHLKESFFSSNFSEMDHSVENQEKQHKKKKKSKVKLELVECCNSDTSQHQANETTSDYLQIKRMRKEKKNKLAAESETIVPAVGNMLHDQNFKKHRVKKETKVELHKQIKKEPESCGSDD